MLSPIPPTYIIIRSQIPVNHYLCRIPHCTEAPFV